MQLRAAVRCSILPPRAPFAYPLIVHVCVSGGLRPVIRGVRYQARCPEDIAVNVRRPRELFAQPLRHHRIPDRAYLGMLTAPGPVEDSVSSCPAERANILHYVPGFGGSRVGHNGAAHHRFIAGTIF